MSGGVQEKFLIDKDNSGSSDRKGSRLFLIRLWYNWHDLSIDELIENIGKNIGGHVEEIVKDDTTDTHKIQCYETGHKIEILINKDKIESIKLVDFTYEPMTREEYVANYKDRNMYDLSDNGDIEDILDRLQGAVICAADDGAFDFETEAFLYLYIEHIKSKLIKGEE